MEHRIGLRIKLNTVIELWCGGEKAGNFQAHDISHGGLFINDRLKDLNSGNLVEVRLGSGAIDNKEPFLLRAFIIRQSHTGTGLMWAGRNLDFHNELNRLRTKKMYANG